MRDAFNSFARAVNDFVSSPWALATAFALIVLWAATGPAFHYSDGWQLIVNTGTTIVTFLMVFVLNNAQSRDTAAMNAKLDAVIFAITEADNRLIGIERKTGSEAEDMRAEIAAAAADAVKELHEEVDAHDP